MIHSPLFWLFNVVAVMAASALTIFSARSRNAVGRYLCEDCRFNHPQSCLKTDRPAAVFCTSYRQGEVQLKQISEKP